MRKMLMPLFVSLAVVGHVQAQPESPDRVIEQTTAELQSRIAAEHQTYEQNKEAFYSMVDEQVERHFDTKTIAMFILGRHLKQVTPEQLARFEEAFKNMLIRQYADNLLEYYDTVTVEAKPARVSGDRASVDVLLKRPNKQPIPMTFSMREKDGVWRVWDVKVENLSLVLNFRAQIDSQIQRSSVTEVIDRLEQGALQVAPPQGLQDEGSSG